MTYAEIVHDKARQAYIMVVPSLHEHRVHIPGEVREQGSVCALEDGQLRGDDLPCRLQRYGHDGEGDVEHARDVIGEEVGERIWLIAGGACAW